MQHIEYGRISGIVGLVKAQADFPVNLPDFQPIHIFQSEKRVHKPDIAFYLRHSYNTVIKISRTYTTNCLMKHLQDTMRSGPEVTAGLMITMRRFYPAGRKCPNSPQQMSCWKSRRKHWQRIKKNSYPKMKSWKNSRKNYSRKSTKWCSLRKSWSAIYTLMMKM